MAKLFNVEQKPRRFTVKRIAIVFAVLIVVVGVSVAGYWGYAQYEVAQQAEQKRDDLFQSSDKMTAENQEEIYKKHEGDYQTAKKTVYDTPIDEWTRETLDDAYLVIVFNDKTGGIGEVNDALIMLDYAQSSGLNLDDNSWGFNETDRNAFKQRMLDRQAKYEAEVQ